MADMKLQKKGCWSYRNHYLKHFSDGWRCYRLYGHAIKECGASKTREKAARRLDMYLTLVPS